MNAHYEVVYKEILRRLRAAHKVAETIGYMFEDVDFDSVTGKRIHNFTITWTQPEEEA